MNQLVSHTQTPSEQFWLALEWDNIFDMQASMENWFQRHYQDASLRVFWKEQFERRRRTQDQEAYNNEEGYLHMEYEWFRIYGNDYTLLIYTKEEDSEQKIENDFPSYKPHILKRVQDISIADTDALTGLCSAKIFFQKSKKLDENPDSQYAVVYFDLDDLKGINTRHGHLGGDAYIKAFAEVLNNHYRSYDCKVRKWWDEFVVIITDGQEYSESALQQKIESVQKEF